MYTDIITEKDTIAGAIMIVDANNILVKKVISYNNKTKETVVYKVDGMGRVETSNGVVLTETKILTGSRIVFKLNINGSLT